MRKLRLIWLFTFLISHGLIAQHRVTLHVTVSSKLKHKEPVFFAGNINGWNPGDSAFMFRRDSSFNTLTFLVDGSQKLEFKLTRGTWSSVETDSRGHSISNRALNIHTDTTVHIEVSGWADEVKRHHPKHTSSHNVKLMDSAFAIPQLNTTRPIWIYLPPGYKGLTKRYPVIYAQDGQNLFDDFIAPFGEWGIDETLDSLHKTNHIDCIVVGIGNSSKRLQEYNPYNNERFGEGLGTEYTDFLVNTLKPYIDSHYRTLKDPAHTLIMGSSMGGLISYYASLTHPDVFGKAGIFSPSFWIAPEIDQLTDSLAPRIKGMFFFYVGKKESDSMVIDMKRTADHLAKNSKALLYSVIDDNGKHNEAAWRKWFPEFVRWIFSNGYNYKLKVH